MPFQINSRILYYIHTDSSGFLQILGQVSYGDIDHWMWRLYLDDFGEFCDSIGLPVCPYAELRPDDPLPPPTTLLYGISPRVIEKPQYWPERWLCTFHFSSSNFDHRETTPVIKESRQAKPWEIRKCPAYYLRIEQRRKLPKQYKGTAATTTKLCPSGKQNHW